MLPYSKSLPYTAQQARDIADALEELGDAYEAAFDLFETADCRRQASWFKGLADWLDGNK